MEPNEIRRRFTRWCEENGGDVHTKTKPKKQVTRCYIDGGEIYYDGDHVSVDGLQSGGTSGRSVGRGPSQRIKSEPDPGKDAMGTPMRIETSEHGVRFDSDYESLNINIR